LSDFGIELKKHLRKDLLQFGYNDTFAPVP